MKTNSLLEHPGRKPAKGIKNLDCEKMASFVNNRSEALMHRKVQTKMACAHKIAGTGPGIDS